MSDKHKVFISYYHKDDEKYRTQFEKLFEHLFISKSVNPGDIDTEDGTEYVKRLIREEYVTDASVIVVLMGNKTYCRKYVDWEIYAGLYGSGGKSGLLGLWLPSHPDYDKEKYKPKLVPARLHDNSKSEYAKMYDWTKDEIKIKRWVEQAFQDRIKKEDKIDNSREQMKQNTCD